MSIVEMIALVAAVTEFIKVKVLPKVEIKGVAAVILTAVITVGVVAFDFLQNSKPFDFIGFLTIAVQVFGASNLGYQLLKVSKPKLT